MQQLQRCCEGRTPWPLSHQHDGQEAEPNTFLERLETESIYNISPMSQTLYMKIFRQYLCVITKAKPFFARPEITVEARSAHNPAASLAARAECSFA